MRIVIIIGDGLSAAFAADELAGKVLALWLPVMLFIVGGLLDHNPTEFLSGVVAIAIGVVINMSRAGG